MNGAGRLLAVFLALAVPATGLAYWTAALSRGARLEAAPVPTRVGEWRVSSEMRFPESELWLVQPDAYTMSEYSLARGPKLWSYVALYSGTGTTIPHDPEICYPAQGWDVLGRRVVELSMTDGRTLIATELRARKDAREHMVLHWFQPAERWPRAPWQEQLLRVLDSVRGTRAYAFVRLSTDATPDGESAELLSDFARSLAPSVRAALVQDVPVNRGN